MELLWNRGMKVCSNGPGHMTKMAAMPIYGKNLKKSSLEPKVQWVLVYYQVCSNDDPGLTLTYFTARSNLAPYAFVCEKGKTGFITNYCCLWLETSNRWLKWQEVSVDIKKLSPGDCMPLPQGCIHVLNHETKSIKSDFKEISLKLATNE